MRVALHISKKKLISKICELEHFAAARRVPFSALIIRLMRATVANPKSKPFDAPQAPGTPPALYRAFSNSGASSSYWAGDYKRVMIEMPGHVARLSFPSARCVSEALQELEGRE